MESTKFLEALKKSLCVTTNKALENKIGLTQATMISWRKNQTELTTSQVASVVKKAIRKSEINARQYSIHPIVEYYPIVHTESKHGAKWEVLNKSVERCKKLRDLLNESHGIYIFYNSQCRAIYVGKANRLSLWNEMNGAFNRDRDAQNVWRVDHPTIGTTFKPAFETPRKIAKHNVNLYDIAHYFSAYSIEKDLIDNAEALLIRAFANGLTNHQMENIKIKRNLTNC